MSTAFTKEILISLLRPLSDLINGKTVDDDGLLDPAISGLLKASKTVIPHSRDTRVLQFHINARAQPTVFHPHHFKYAVQYDPFGTMAGTSTKNFCIEFYLSKVRIYHERDEMVKRVRRDLSRLRLPGFEFGEGPKSFSYEHKFKAAIHDELIHEVREYLFPLLRIMDAFNITMTKEERRAVILGREKISFVDRNSPHHGNNMEFRREVSPTLRAQVFRRDGYICQHCEKLLPPEQLAADHVIPVARGGLTILGNLQCLCAPCNGKKGKRLEAELRARYDIERDEKGVRP